MLDSDLAELYGVPTKRLNEQVRRNLERFPPDFMFQLDNQEVELLRSQNATLKTGRGQHSKYLPHVFSELETKVGKHDQTIRSLVAAIRQLMQPPVTPDKKQIGFKV